MKPTATPGSVRIIAGELRGRRLPVADRPGLRPTSDRVRETLFNWLQSQVAGARVLDLFAGTGALGFEAVSRGAAHVTLFEKDPQLAASLQATAKEFRVTTQARVECADAVRMLQGVPGQAFDVVFLDPPFAAGLHSHALNALQAWTHAGSLLYVEAPVKEHINVPLIWRPLREGSTRDVSYRLFQRVD